MLLKMFFPIYVVFVAISSILLGKTSNELFLVLSGVVFLLHVHSEAKFPLVRYFQILTLACFHYLSQLNWSMPLYLLLAANEMYQTEKLKNTTILSTISVIIFTCIRLSYSEGTFFDYLRIGVDFISFWVVTMGVFYLIRSEREKKFLQLEKRHLSTHDALTGLINFQEFHHQLEKLLEKDRAFGLFIIDCIDLKSMNNQQGFESGNDILLRIAHFLQQKLPDSSIIARYGGDEFAFVIMASQKNDISDVIRWLDTDFPQSLGIQVTYGYASFSDDGTSKDDLFSAAERRLVSMKRDKWLKREEHMFRTEKLKVVGELAAGMAHEIRNPITTVKGFLQISRENQYNIEKWYDLIMHEITRVSELTSEFLQFSKPHVTNYKIQSVHECILRVIYLTESEASFLGHTVQYNYDDKPIQILMDKDKMVQVMLNLVKNSFEAMNQQGTVSIRLFENEMTTIIEIEDTGSGIPESELDQIFHPFFTTKDHGTGLGLAICHKIIQDHNGFMEIKSEENVGTLIKIILPLSNT